MTSLRNLIPKNKFDMTSIDALKIIEPDVVKPILEEFMEWMQDINWPVSKELIKILPRFHIELVPIIRNILNTG